MKTPSLAALLLAAATVPAAACERVAEIRHVRVGGGPVLVAVYADEASFRKTAVAGFKLAPDKTTLALPLCDVRVAELAVVAYQDMNANDKLDANLLGLPTEPWGASGSGTLIGPPSWASARVRADTGVIAVELSK